MRMLGRWRGTDTVPFGAREGAYLASPVDALARRIAARGAPAKTAKQKIVDHIYVVDDAPRPVRRRTHDQARSLPAARPQSRDQAQPELLCRVGQHGETGEFSATGPNDEPLRIENGKGGFEVWREPEAGEGGENLAGTSPPGATSLDRLRRRIGPRQNVGDRDQQHFQMESMQAYLDELHRPRS